MLAGSITPRGASVLPVTPHFYVLAENEGQ